MAFFIKADNSVESIYEAMNGGNQSLTEKASRRAIAESIIDNDDEYMQNSEDTAFVAYAQMKVNENGSFDMSDW